MLKRMLLLPLSLAAAGGVPFIAMNKDFTSRFQAALEQFTSDDSQTTAEGDDLVVKIPNPFANNVPASSTSTGSAFDLSAEREAAFDQLERMNPFQFASDNRGSSSAARGQTNSPIGSGVPNQTPPAFPSAQSQASGIGYPGQGNAQYPGGPTPTYDPRLPDGWPRTPVLGTDLREVIRFDITPNWIKANWPRVSTGWTEDGLEGFRVPLVTGTRIDSLTGALTYFFDAEHRVQRIRFVGNSGDAAPIVDLCERYFEMKVEPTRLAGFYARNYNGEPVSVLRVTHESVLRADAPNLHLRIVLEINSPGGPFKLSQAVQEQLQVDPVVVE